MNTLKTLALMQLQKDWRHTRPHWVFARARVMADGWTTSFPAFNRAYHARVRLADPTMAMALDVLGDQGIYLAAVSVPKLETYLAASMKIPRVYLVRTVHAPQLADVPLRGFGDADVETMDLKVPRRVKELLAWLQDFGVMACVSASQRRKPIAPRRWRHT